MSYPVRNVVVFGAPTIDRRFVIELAGAPSLKIEDPSPTIVFETRKHSVTVSQQRYIFYDTAGLSDSTEPLNPREALRMLYRFTSVLEGGINLLIYVVDYLPTERNYRLFYEYLCRRDVPIILISNTPNDKPTASGFKFVKELPRYHNEDEIRKAIREKCKKKVNLVSSAQLFEETAMASWRLLEKSARWSLAACREALKATWIEQASLSEADAEKKCDSLTDYMKRKYFRNVIVFGSTGAGKTSVIHMLTDKCNLGDAANSAGGSTFATQGYTVEIGEYRYMFHDTVGLNDATSATLSPQAALRELFQLMTKVEGGVSLLVYVHRGKIEPAKLENYKLFNAICQNKVPIALIVTGLEEEDSMDDWWEENKSLFERSQIQTEYVACITATKGKKKNNQHTYQSEYDESSKRLKNLFLDAPLEDAWKVKTSNWVTTALVDVYSILAKRFHWRPWASNQWLVDSIVLHLKIPRDEAAEMAGSLESVLKR